MSESDQRSLRDALLKVATGSPAVDAGLAQLRQLMDAEQARVRRLVKWTKRVWIAAAIAGVAVLLSFIGYAMVGQSFSRLHEPPAVGWQILGVASAAMFFVCAPALPALVVVGIVLLVMCILARRSLGMQEMRAALAGIDAQLRVLAVSQAGQSAGGTQSRNG